MISVQIALLLKALLSVVLDVSSSLHSVVVMLSILCPLHQVRKFLSVVSRYLVHFQRTFLGKGEAKGTPLEPRQGRTPAPPFPNRSLDFALASKQTLVRQLQAWKMTALLLSRR